MMARPGARWSARAILASRAGPSCAIRLPLRTPMCCCWNRPTAIAIIGHLRLRSTNWPQASSALSGKQGVVLVPAFAVGRTQEFLYYLNSMSRAGRLRDLRIFVDSPMATEVTRITARHFDLFDAEARRLAREPVPEGRAPVLRFIETVEESKALNSARDGAIIVAASGMCDGGRIRHHLRHHLSNPRTMVLFVGFQAVGTLGRRIVDGAQTVRIAGEEVAVRAEIVTLGGFSAHADRSALLDWLAAFRRAPGRIFLVHGEEDSSRALAAAIGNRFGRSADIPAHRTSVAL